MGKTCGEITGKPGNKMRQVWTHTRAPITFPKLKSLQDLSIRINRQVTEEVVHHAGLRVDRSLHLYLHMCKVIHPLLESSDPFHRVLSLVNPITDVALQRSVPVRVLGRGGGFSSEARLGVTMRGLVTTALMVTRVANPIPSVSLGSWGWVCGVVVVCCATSIWDRLREQGGPTKLWHASPIQSNYSVRLSKEYSTRPELGN
jgi:hypothetical protein